MTSLGTLSLAAALVAALFSGCDERLDPPPAAQSTTGVRNTRAATDRLIAVLKQLQAAPTETVRDQLIAALRGRAAWADAPVSWVLEQDDHDFLLEAIELAAKLPLLNSRSRLARLAHRGPARARGLAVAAAHRLRPWDANEFRALMRHPDADVVLAALALETEKPLDVLVELFSRPEPTVRTAAVAAIPTDLGKAEMLRLLELGATGDSTTSKLAIAALGGDRLSPATELGLTQFALEPAKTVGVRVAALRALGTKTTRLRQPEAILGLARDPKRSLRERAHALLCLESSRSSDAASLGDATAFPPVLRYYVARCLIGANDLAGFDILIKLLESKELQRAESAAAITVFNATRDLLGTFSSTDSNTPVAQWRLWFQRLESFPTWVQVPPAATL